jgi:predicted small integral membrane protein
MISFFANLINPLVGQPGSIAELISIITNYILNLAIPISVIIIIYGGFRMLTSRGVPASYQKGLDALKYASLGLAVLLIAKGFVSLIQSILSVK